MNSPLDIIKKYYPEDNELRRLLIQHSTQVAAKALAVVARHPELQLDADLIYRGAMLHDIGIFMTDAPGIFCFGKDPYLTHGINGAKIMRAEGDEAVARICQRHTGTGLTAEQIEAQNLPLQPGVYEPQTLEEQVVCYADKFFSKSRPTEEKTLERVLQSLRKFGEEGVDVFLDWHEKFS